MKAVSNMKRKGYNEVLKLIDQYVDSLDVPFDVGISKVRKFVEFHAKKLGVTTGSLMYQWIAYRDKLRSQQIQQSVE